MAIDTVAALLKELRGSPILRPDQFKELVEVHAVAHRDVQDLARQLIRLRWLTVYQAKKILAGKINELVIGHYTILDKLGEGGMGRVFKAVQQTLSRVVALKVVRSSLLKNEVALKRFRREVKAAAALSHGNIVRVFDADQDGDRHFLAMENIEGSDLGKLVKANGPLPVPVACSYIRQAALGLQHAHDLNFVHRDIKPSNLLVAVNEKGQYGPRNVVKILDMGLARTQGEDPAGEHVSTELTRAGTVVGTPDYMSPEQAKNSSNVDSRSDLYSLGCTFFYLLTGEEVFPNGTPLEKLLQHQLDAPRPVQLLRMDLPAEVASIVQCLLAKKPEHRFQSGSALANALEPWCALNAQSALNPAVAMAAEAHEAHEAVGMAVSPSEQSLSPFNFNDDDDPNPSPPVRETRAVSRTPLMSDRGEVSETKPRAWKLALIVLAGVIGALIFAVVGVTILREVLGNKSKSVAQVTSEPAPKGEPAPKADPKPREETKPREEKLPDYLDSLEKFIPDDSMMVLVFDVKNFSSTDTARRHLFGPLQSRFFPIKAFTGIDFFQKVERVIVAVSDKKTSPAMVIFQGRSLAGEWLPEMIHKIPGITFDKHRESGIEIARIGPGKDDVTAGKTMHAVQVGTSVLICESRQRILTALEKREGARRTKFEDPSLEAGLAVIYRHPFVVTTVFGTHGQMASLSPNAKQLKYFLAGAFFDDRGMHFYTAADEEETGKSGAEFQKALAALFKKEAKKDGETDERIDKIADLFAEARFNILGGLRFKNYNTGSIVRTPQLDAWLKPFLEDKPAK